jgi:AraC family transcriptional regulator of adaptative response/methylated-DNA-[protein]-cysteine methyltransferase
MTMTATGPTTTDSDRGADTDEWSDRVAAACRLLAACDDGVPALAEVAAQIGVSPDALRRAFVRKLGVTPRKYADTLRRERLREELRDGTDVTSALFTAGYGSTSRLYEAAHEHLGMTPASYKAGGAGARVLFTVADTTLGSLLVAVTDRGLCKIDLSDDAGAVEESLYGEFHAADIERDDAALAPVVGDVVARLDGRVPTQDLPLDVQGTAFQRRVWEELRRIPAGETRTYGEVAEAIGAPRAHRAVGSACGANPVPIVVPCHRVVPASGGVGNYGLGPSRKVELLRREGSLGQTERPRRTAGDQG